MSRAIILIIIGCFWLVVTGFPGPTMDIHFVTPAVVVVPVVVAFSIFFLCKNSLFLKKMRDSPTKSFLKK